MLSQMLTHLGTAGKNKDCRCEKELRFGSEVSPTYPRFSFKAEKPELDVHLVSPGGGWGCDGIPVVFPGTDAGFEVGSVCSNAVKPLSSSA